MRSPIPRITLLRTAALAAWLATLGAAQLCAGALKAGFAKADVTPSEPINMGGYDLRNAPSDGVHGNDRLYVRSLAFDDGSQKLLMIEGDVIMIRDHDEFRKQISAATGVPAANILLGDAHNHAAPSPSPKGENKWERQFAAALISTAQKSIANLAPARIAAGTGRSRIAMNRRQVKTQDTDSFLTFDENDVSQSFGKAKTNDPVKIHEFAGVMRLGANPDGPIDDAVQVVRIDTDQGRPIVAMIHYACHGTSLGGRNSKISGEWMGRMQEYLEKQVPGVGAMYLQGAAGDINPRVVGGLDGNPDDIQRDVGAGRRNRAGGGPGLPGPRSQAIGFRARDREPGHRATAHLS